MPNLNHSEYQKWTFDAIDSLFFRESRQMDAIGGTGLNSIFPPSPYTLAGAIRSYIGNCHEIDWLKFRQHQDEPLKDSNIKLSDFLTTTTDFKEWSIIDYYITIDNKKLYNIPLFILNKAEQWTFLEIPEEIIRCDLGNVRLPSTPKKITEGGFKPIENAYVTEDIYQKFLNGDELNDIKYYKNSDLFTKDERLGISLDNQRKGTIDGMLYQTQHLRLKDNVKIEVITKNLHKVLKDEHRKGVIRLGGEGRLASVEISACEAPKPLIAKDLNQKNIVVILNTTADFKDDKNNNLNMNWIFPNFTEACQDVKYKNYENKEVEAKQTIWEGKINGVSLRIHACVLGKIQREGGWEKKSNDSKKGQPRSIKTLIPAGSAYYCEILDKDIQTAISKLKNSLVGVDNQLGRGRLSIGLWK